MNVVLTKEIVKDQVKTLRVFLSEGGYQLSQTSAYQCMAKIYGFESWTVLANKLKESKK